MVRRGQGFFSINIVSFLCLILLNQIKKKVGFFESEYQTQTRKAKSKKKRDEKKESQKVQRPTLTWEKQNEKEEKNERQQVQRPTLTYMRTGLKGGEEVK